MAKSTALTGGIASGKSRVADLLAQRGAVIIDSDVISRELVEPGTPGLAAVVARFGPEILRPDGSLDRPALGALVFADADARADLEGILHPRIRARADELRAAAPPGSVVIDVIPLLVEAGLADRFDEVIVVDVPTEVQIERLAQRDGFDRAQAESRLAAQATRAQRLAVADHVVVNTGSLEELAASVDRLWSRLGVDPLDLGATDLADALRSGRPGVADHLRAVLDRIGRLDPDRLAFSALNPAARADAERLDALPADERAGLPLFGVPVAVKEEIAVAGMVTTLGTRAATRPAPVDAEVVARLRAAGAIIVGTTRMPEFGQAPYTDGPWGATRNPFDPTRSAGGSSGGSAVAVATRMVPVALGGDGGGSIRIPSAWCGIVGLKPTRGVVTTAPLADLWHLLGTYGPMARTVDDLDLLLGVIGDPAPATPPGRLRIGWTLGCSLPWITPDPEVADAVARAAATLAGDGHEVSAGTVRWPRNPLAFLVQFYRGIADEVALLEHPRRLERRSRRTAALGRLVRDPVLAWAVRGTERLARRTARLFTRLDILLTPVTPMLPPPIPHLHDRGALASQGVSTPAISHTNHWNMAGNPAASVPVGLSRDGLPLAVQVIGAPGADRLVLAVARRLARSAP